MMAGRRWPGAEPVGPPARGVRAAVPRASGAGPEARPDPPVATLAGPATALQRKSGTRSPSTARRSMPIARPMNFRTRSVFASVSLEIG
jgi:hypothetical protein